MNPGDTIALAKPEDVGMSRERMGAITDRLAAEVERGRLPGAVSIVARRGRIAHFKAVGRLDPARDEPMDRDAIFRIYSMTKPIVSTALMMMVEEGRLTLSDPLSTFLPAFADMKVGTETLGQLALEPAGRPITLHDLLRHTSGLTYEWIAESAVEKLYRDRRVNARGLSNAEQAEALASLPLALQPGSGWLYGRSTDVIGRVIEIVSGQTLGDHLAERIFAPLGMVDTGFAVPEWSHARMAEPFAKDPDSGEPVRLIDLRTAKPSQSGGGGLASTASDYARFLHALSGGSIDGNRLLSPATVAFMLADHLEPGHGSNTDLLPPGYGFGLGFAVRRSAGLAPFAGSVGDAFWQGLGGTSFWIDPANALYAILMIQAPGRLEYFRDVFRNLVYAAIED